MTDTVHYADAAWDTDRIGIYTPNDEPIAEGDLGWVDPDDDSTIADQARRDAITAALAALGWQPIPGEEWPHIDGGLQDEAGAERVPVQRKPERGNPEMAPYTLDDQQFHDAQADARVDH